MVRPPRPTLSIDDPHWLAEHHQIMTRTSRLTPAAAILPLAAARA